MRVLFIVILITLLILLFMKTKKKSIYSVAYELGKSFLDKMDLYANYSVMFDIDDTLIYSKNHRKITDIIKLLKYCKKKGLLVSIVTARDSVYTNETVKELKYHNIDYDILYLRHSPKEDHDMFKSNFKQMLYEKHGIVTIMSIGDNIIDTAGEYSGYCIKLPNITDPRLFHKNHLGQMVNVVN